jgi:hypothetical protein
VDELRERLDAPQVTTVQPWTASTATLPLCERGTSAELACRSHTRAVPSAEPVTANLWQGPPHEFLLALLCAMQLL